MIATVNAFDPLAFNDQKQAKRSTLALPSQIVSHGSTATIVRIRAMNFYELSMFSGKNWHEPPRSKSPMRVASWTL
jgi:hypothetical protein